MNNYGSQCFALGHSFSFSVCSKQCSMSFCVKKHSRQTLYYARAALGSQHTNVCFFKFKGKKKREKKKRGNSLKTPVWKAGRYLKRLSSILCAVHVCKHWHQSFCVLLAETIICPQVMTTCLRCSRQVGMQFGLLIWLGVGPLNRSCS